ncbi:hypothetical protein AURDEDRAFT_120954 [Auricularia subglabra TFB-10046 SS5]|nr:hypothetical protein AURDEDRAFT_120954 [Auricularia subglabra TFB-10046 SS5]
MSHFDILDIDPLVVTVVEYRAERDSNVNPWHVGIAALVGALVMLIALDLLLEYSPAARHAVFRCVFDVEFIKHDFGAFIDTCTALPRLCPDAWVPQCNIIVVYSFVAEKAVVLTAWSRGKTAKHHRCAVGYMAQNTSGKPGVRSWVASEVVNAGTESRDKHRRKKWRPPAQRLGGAEENGQKEKMRGL